MVNPPETGMRKIEMKRIKKRLRPILHWFYILFRKGNLLKIGYSTKIVGKYFIS